MGAERLVCVGCGASYPASEHFCPACGLPLTHEAAPGGEPVSERHRLARKIKPQLAEGDLVRVAGDAAGQWRCCSWSPSSVRRWW